MVDRDDSDAWRYWPRAILHVDMDAFFVNVHLLDHPADRGLPLAVGGRPEQRGVVASASYEARALGIHSAMPMSRALRLCPTLKVVSADWERIQSGSRQVMELLATFGPLEQMSVDEAYVDLSDRPNPDILAIRIQAQVKNTTELPCSVGLATCKLVAKVASDHDKPAGCTIVTPGSEADFLAPLPTRALHGVGPVTAERLAALGITTCGELARAPVDRLEAVFHNQGAALVALARGVDNRPVVSEHGPPKSISQERTFSDDIDDPDWLRARLVALSDNLARSLQRHRLLAHTVTIKFRWADFTTFTRQKSTTIPFDDAATIAGLGCAIFDENWPPGQKVRLIGIGVSGLDEATEGQLILPFDELP